MAQNSTTTVASYRIEVWDDAARDWIPAPGDATGWTRGDAQGAIEAGIVGLDGSTYDADDVRLVRGPITVEVGEIAEVHGSYPDEEPLCHYIALDVTVDGVERRVGVMVGARESDHGSVRASGAGVRPFCSAWWADASDRSTLDEEEREAVESALINASYSLYCAAADE